MARARDVQRPSKPGVVEVLEVCIGQDHTRVLSPQLQQHRRPRFCPLDRDELPNLLAANEGDVLDPRVTCERLDGGRKTGDNLDQIGRVSTRDEDLADGGDKVVRGPGDILRWLHDDGVAREEGGDDGGQDVVKRWAG